MRKLYLFVIIIIINFIALCVNYNIYSLSNYNIYGAKTYNFITPCEIVICNNLLRIKFVLLF